MCSGSEEELLKLHEKYAVPLKDIYLKKLEIINQLKDLYGYRLPKNWFRWKMEMGSNGTFKR